MGRSIASLLLSLAIAATLASCGGTVSDEYVIEDQPYKLEPIEGKDVLKVILTPKSVERLGIETTTVERRGRRTVVPYDAVYLDAHGDFWVYTNPEPQVFVRAPIEIVRESSTEAFLRDGPPTGTTIVTVGVPELYGTETEFGV